MARNPTQRLVKSIGSFLRLDGWQNALAGMGTSRDKTKTTRWKISLRLLHPEFLDAFYAENDIAQTIVGAIVDDALRQGFYLGSPDPDEQVDEEKAREDLELCESFGVVGKVREGAIWGRLYGKAGLLLVVTGAGNAEEPMGEGGELLDIVVVDRRELQPLTWYQDPLAEKFGEPETYLLTPTASYGTSTTSVTVHESRLVLFGGALTPKRIKAYNEGCDLSVLQAAFDVLKKVEGNFDAVCAMFADMSVGVLKMQGLIEAISAGKQADLAARFELMDQMKGNTRTLPLDAELEDFEYRERGALSGVGDLLDKSWVRLAKLAEMPVTRLMGISPGGLNATGESDRKFWFDRVASFQRMVLKPAIEQIVLLITGEEYEVCFPDLETEDPLEEGQRMVAQAQTDKAYFDMGALTPAEIAMVRFGKGKWSPGYDDIDMEAHEGALDRELEELENPPEPVVDPLAAPGAPGEEGAVPAKKPPVAPRADSDDQPRDENGQWTDGGGNPRAGAKADKGRMRAERKETLKRDVETLKTQRQTEHTEEKKALVKERAESRKQLESERAQQREALAEEEREAHDEETRGELDAHDEDTKDEVSSLHANQREELADEIRSLKDEHSEHLAEDFEALDDLADRVEEIQADKNLGDDEKRAALQEARQEFLQASEEAKQRRAGERKTKAEERAKEAAERRAFDLKAWLASRSDAKGKSYISVEKTVNGNTRVVEHASKKAAHAYGMAQRRAGADISVHEADFAKKFGLDPREANAQSRGGKVLGPDDKDEFQGGGGEQDRDELGRFT